jgi:hypothetical protein
MYLRATKLGLIVCQMLPCPCANNCANLEDHYTLISLPNSRDYFSGSSKLSSLSLTPNIPPITAVSLLIFPLQKNAKCTEAQSR